MRKVRTLLMGFLCFTLLVTPALSGHMSASAYVAAYDEEFEEETDPTILESVAIGTLALGIIEKLFCPKTPQNRCKSHICKSGACVSFRSSCDGSGPC